MKHNRTSSKWIVTPGLKPVVAGFISFLDNAITKSPSQTKPLMICGDTGVGKSLFVDIFKDKFKRLRGCGNDKIITVNFAALHQGTISSELFGHEKGAFTGAIRDKIGLLERADKGLLIIEEIGELSKEDQARLLTFIEDGYYYPLGSEKEKHSEVTIIGTTHVVRNKFRDDFWSRFMQFYVPPIFERRMDVLYYFKHKFSDLFLSLSKAELLTFLAYNWPGNVREIENIGQVMQSQDTFRETLRLKKTIGAGEVLSSFMYKPSRYNPFCFNQFPYSPFSKNFLIGIQKYGVSIPTLHDYLDRIGFDVSPATSAFREDFELKYYRDEISELKGIVPASEIEQYNTGFYEFCSLLVFKYPVKANMYLFDLKEGDNEGFPELPLSPRSAPEIVSMYKSILKYRSRGDDTFFDAQRGLKPEVSFQDDIDGKIGELRFKLRNSEFKDSFLDDFSDYCRKVFYIKALEKNNANKAKTAKEIGVAVNTFKSRLIKYNNDEI